MSGKNKTCLTSLRYRMGECRGAPDYNRGDIMAPIKSGPCTDLWAAIIVHRYIASVGRCMCPSLLLSWLWLWELAVGTVFTVISCTGTTHIMLFREKQWCLLLKSLTSHQPYGSLIGGPECLASHSVGAGRKTGSFSGQFQNITENINVSQWKHHFEDILSVEFYHLPPSLAFETLFSIQGCSFLVFGAAGRIAQTGPHSLPRSCTELRRSAAVLRNIVFIPMRFSLWDKGDCWVAGVEPECWPVSSSSDQVCLQARNKAQKLAFSESLEFTVCRDMTLCLH